jgi:hypothetical protein
MNNPQFPTARKTGLVVQEVPNEVLVYDLETNKAHCLNSTASIVWKACDGTNSVTDIASIVASESGAKISDDLVWLAIDQLNENSLLETEVKAEFAGKSRRDAIKKIGLASMIALPIVASLIAPKSAMASVSCNCTVPSNAPTGDPSCQALGCGFYCGCSFACTDTAPTTIPCPGGAVEKSRKGA